MRKEVKVLRPFKRYKVGDIFTVSASDARVLEALGRVEIVNAPNKAIELSPVTKKTVAQKNSAPEIPVTPPPPPPLPVETQVPALKPLEPPVPEVKETLPFPKPGLPPRSTITRNPSGKPGKGD